MGRKCFITVESWSLASPALAINGIKTDIGLLAEALVLFDEVVLNIQTSHNLADILNSFLKEFGNINSFLELVSSGAIQFHFYDFTSAPIKKNGVFTYWNIQDKTATESHQLSFEQKILNTGAIDSIVCKSRHRKNLYKTLNDSVVIESSEDYGPAIEAARDAIKSNADIQNMLENFVRELPFEYKNLFPDEITVTSDNLQDSKVIHHYSFDFNEVGSKLPNLMFGDHIPGLGIIQTHRALYTSCLRKYDLYLPSPLGLSVQSKLFSLTVNNKRFQQSIVDLRSEALFPDIRTGFNDGNISWKDILELRSKAGRFRKWFNANGGDPEVAIKTYGEEFKSSTGYTHYSNKAFAIVQLIGTVTGVGAEKLFTGQTSVLGPMLGSILANVTPFARELFKASEEEGWQPRFFGNWVHQYIKNK